MSLRRAIDVKWAILVVLGFIAVWIGAYYYWPRSDTKLPPMNRQETRVGVMCTNVDCQARDVVTLQQFDEMERNDIGMIKCPECGEFTYALDRHYQPEVTPEPAP